MFHKLKAWFSPKLPPSTTISRDQLAWLLSGLALMTKKPPLSGNGFLENTPLTDVQAYAEELGVSLIEVPSKFLFDESNLANLRRYVVLFEKPGEPQELGLLLPQSASETILVTPGGAPQKLTDEDLKSLLAVTKHVIQLKTIEPLPQEAPERFGWQWFTKAFFKRKTAIRDVLIGSLFVQLIGLASPLATQAIVDKVIQNQAVNTLIALGIGIALLALFSGALSWLRQLFLLRLANVVDGELAKEVFAHLLKLPLRFFEHRATGVIINRVHGVERVREFFAGTFTLVALELPFAFIFASFMVTYSLKLSGVVLAFVSLMVFLSFMAGPRLRSLINEQSQLGAKVQGYLTEHVGAVETLKSLQLEPQAIHRFQELNTAYLDAARGSKEFGNNYGTLMQLLEQLMNASILCLGAYLAMTTTDLTIGMLVAFQMFAQRVSQPLLRLSGAWQELQQVRVAVKQLGDLMNVPTERYSALQTSSANNVGRLEVSGLGFRHGEDRPWLYENLSFAIEPGEIVLVTGASGSGKSSLAKVLLGLYHEYKGTIKLDGRELRSMSSNEIRRFFGVVPQETVLFSGTVAENLMTVAPNAPFEAVVEACKWSGVHAAIENLSNGYMTELGERGVGLSGGQRQRIGIARALLKKPKVFIFDEATSSLDDASSRLIAETVNKMRGKATVLFIAHKIPDNLKFDRHLSLSQSTAS